jgi:hypothetical protein
MQTLSTLFFRSSLLLLAILLLGCKKKHSPGCLTSSGPLTEQRRDLPAFSKIEIENAVETHIVHDSIYRVDVETGANLQRKIITKVSNDTLYIRDKNTCNFVRGYSHTPKVTIHLPYLRKLTNNSVHPAWFESKFIQDSIRIHAGNSGDVHVYGTYGIILSTAHGNGDIYYSGKTKTILLYTNGTNYIYAQDLEITSYAGFETYSIGDCIVNGNGLPQLDFHIVKSGNIKCIGQPKVVFGKIDSTARGQFIPL